jgi:putative phage-type endonuclease
MSKELAIIESAVDRRQFIGSSDVAAIIGLSPFKTPYEVWEEKVAEIPVEEDSAILRRGRRAEPFLIETLKSEFNVWVHQANVVHHHPDYPFLRAQSDIIYVIDPDLVDAEFPEVHPDPNRGHGEIKSVGFNRGEWGEADSQDVPAYVLAQVMFALACNELSEATIWGCFGFDDIRPYRFPYDAEAGEALVDAAVKFWTNHVVPRVPPPTTTTEDCRRALERFQGFTWEASPMARALAVELREAKLNIKIAESVKDRLEKAFLDELLGAAEIHGIQPNETRNISILVCGEKFATYNLQHRKGYEVKETDFRVLRFAGGKKGEQ